MWDLDESAVGVIGDADFGDTEHVGGFFELLTTSFGQIGPSAEPGCPTSREGDQLDVAAGGRQRSDDPAQSERFVVRMRADREHSLGWREHVGAISH